jgi:2-oxoglutarate dehydrogenase E2 component (dihydrolipoamide succinyltransferase)
MPGTGGIRRVPMTTIRKKIAQRLVEAQHTAAILTTFNEIDMSAVMAAREKYKDKFKEKHGVGLGFMGFFVKACVHAAREVPEVNAFIEGDETVYHDYVNVGVAVGTEKGLIVPVIKNAEQLSLAGIELAIRDFAARGRDGKITPNDMAGGTFTISNGGTYGSLMSTPILNPPQSGILGMHKIEDRPVVVNKEIVIRPMMYVALSYDHRIIDGKGAVTFLVKVKEAIEDPSRLLLEV